MAGAVTNGVESDGRAARRTRNREAVLDALIALFTEGEFTPTVEVVAQRSGVSLRSVYRYFDDRAALAEAALTRVMDRLEPYFTVPDAGQGPLGQRIRTLADARLSLYGHAAPIARVARALAPSDPRIAARLELSRDLLTDQLRTQFAPELAALGDEQRARTVAALDTMFAIEALDNLVVRHGLGPEGARSVLERSMLALLEASQ